MLDIKKMLLALLTIAFIVSFLSMSIVNAEEVRISDYDNVPAKQVINDINNVVNAGSSEGEKRYGEDYVYYGSMMTPMCGYYYRLVVIPENAFVGQAVNATAFTNNLQVTHVTFVWVKSFDGIKKVETVPVYLKNGLKEANSTYKPDETGRWWVFAFFEKRVTSQWGCGCRWLYAIRWKCFTVIRIPQQIPDYPVVGTAGAMTTMLIGLGLFLNKKRQKPI